MVSFVDPDVVQLIKLCAGVHSIRIVLVCCLSSYAPMGINLNLYLNETFKDWSTRGVRTSAYN